MTVKSSPHETHFFVHDVFKGNPEKLIVVLMHLKPEAATKKLELSKTLEVLEKKLKSGNITADEEREIRREIGGFNHDYHSIHGTTTRYKLPQSFEKKLSVGLVLKKIPEEAVQLK